MHSIHVVNILFFGMFHHCKSFGISHCIVNNFNLLTYCKLFSDDIIINFIELQGLHETTKCRLMSHVLLDCCKAKTGRHGHQPALSGPYNSKYKAI